MNHVFQSSKMFYLFSHCYITQNKLIASLVFLKLLLPSSLGAQRSERKTRGRNGKRGKEGERGNEISEFHFFDCQEIL